MEVDVTQEMTLKHDSFPWPANFEMCEESEIMLGAACVNGGISQEQLSPQIF